jgi:hypothetical protein
MQEVLEFMREDFASKYKRMKREAGRREADRSQYRYEYSLSVLHLLYAVSSPAWSPWLTGDKEVLEKIQKKAVKIVAGFTANTYEERCAELGLETL